MTNENLNTTTSEATARQATRQAVHTVTGATFTAFDIINREWPFIDASVADTLITAAESVLAVTDPQVDQQTITGVYLVGQTQAADQQERHVTIQQTLVLPNRGVDQSNLPLEVDAQNGRVQAEVSHTGATFDGPLVLTREWPFFDPDTADIVVVAMKARKTVTDPKVDGQTYTGTFLVVDADVQPGQLRTKTIVERLVLPNSGLSSSLPLEADAALHDRKGPRLLEDEGASFFVSEVLIRKWSFFDPDTADLALTTMKTRNTVTDPVADGQTYTGTYGVIDRRAVDGPLRTITIFETLVLWQAWGHDSHAPDLIENDNAGDNNEREIVSKTWRGIQHGDLNSARTEARDTDDANVGADAGFIVTNVHIRDNQNGSFTLIQRQIKQVNNKDTAGQTKVNPLGIETSTLDRTTTTYDNFTAAGLATAVVGEAAPAGFSLVRFDTDIKANGLYIRVYQYAKMTAANGVTAGTPDRSQQTGASGDDTEQDMGRRRADTVDGIAVANAQSVVQTLRTNADDNAWAVEGIRYGDIGQGLARVHRRRRKINPAVSEEDAVFLGSSVTVEDQPVAYTRMWPSVSPDDADVLVGDGAAAFARASFVGDDGQTYQHSSVRRIPDRSSGVVDVIQTGRARAAVTWDNGIMEEEIWAQRFFYINGAVWRRTFGRKVNTLSSVETWANASTARPIGVKGAPLNIKGGRTDKLPGTLWHVGIKETWEDVTAGIDAEPSVGLNNDEFNLLGIPIP